MKTKLFTIYLLLFTSQVFAAGSVIRHLPDIWDSLYGIFRGGRAVHHINQNAPVAEKFYNGMIFNDFNTSENV